MEYCAIKGEQGKKLGIMWRAWERCKSFSGGIGRKAGGMRSSSGKLKMKSKSWPRGLTLTDSVGVGVEIGKKYWRRVAVAPEGCFSIYVGPQKQRFVIKTEYVNHPLFRDLLEEAESEYGYSSEGPLLLPCEVDRFLGVLDQMDFEDNYISKHKGRTRLIGAVTTSSSLITTPPTFLAPAVVHY